MQAALQHGIESLSQAEVGSALQVYFNLGMLTQVSCLLNLSPYSQRPVLPVSCTSLLLYRFCCCSCFAGCTTWVLMMCLLANTTAQRKMNAVYDCYLPANLPRAFLPVRHA